MRSKLSKMFSSRTMLHLSTAAKEIPSPQNKESKNDYLTKDNEYLTNNYDYLTNDNDYLVKDNECLAFPVQGTREKQSKSPSAFFNQAKMTTLQHDLYLHVSQHTTYARSESPYWVKKHS